MMRSLCGPFLLSLCGFFSLSAWAQQQIQATSLREAPVYSKASEDAPVIGKVPRGRRLQLIADFHPEFYQIVSKNGKKGYIRTEDIQIVEAEEWGEEAVMQRQAPDPRPPLFTFDLGASTGSVGGDSYTEFNLGLNWFFASRWAWRNAVFYRIIEDMDDYYGLDSSVRYFHFFRWGRNSGMTFFGGPGVRFPSEGDNLPFAEGGLVFKLGGFSLGGGAKGFFPGLSGSDQESDTQFFIILSGSGTIF